MCVRVRALCERQKESARALDPATWKKSRRVVNQILASPHLLLRRSIKLAVGRHGETTGEGKEPEFDRFHRWLCRCEPGVRSGKQKRVGVWAPSQEA